MKVTVDITRTVMGVRGRPIKNADQQDEQGNMPDLLLRDVIANSLLASQTGDQQKTAEEKVKMYEAARSAIQNDKLTLDVGEWDYIQKRIASSAYSIEAIGASLAMLEDQKQE